MYVKKFINLILETVCRGCRHHFRGQIIPDVYHTIGKEMLKLFGVNSGLVKFVVMGPGVRMGKS